MNLENAEDTDRGRDFRDVFSFHKSHEQDLLRAMSIGMIFGSALSISTLALQSVVADGLQPTIPDLSNVIRYRIQKKIGKSIPGLDHPLTEEEATAIISFFGNKAVQLLFFNCI
ncbi:MAG: hypothetical protein Q7K65_01315 [Candidatus Buchananbacteria bacterium]|nr:hypothetical protein [Candidatus Buchananbacteria bacterium]